MFLYAATVSGLGSSIPPCTEYETHAYSSYFLLQIDHAIRHILKTGLFGPHETARNRTMHLFAVMTARYNTNMPC